MVRAVKFEEDQILGFFENMSSWRIMITVMTIVKRFIACCKLVLKTKKTVKSNVGLHAAEQLLLSSLNVSDRVDAEKSLLRMLQRRYLPNHSTISSKACQELQIKKDAKVADFGN